ncbi:MAG TPA: hypothetical protein VJK03_01435 [Candidatus Nanoarchaeia archaeon]|nr:hypothetical protein [Candidatus Nanoarchaeia archaeon]
MKDEIVGGLRNALELGESLEQAVQSFINAGYPPNEVREAAAILVPSATALLEPSSQPPSPQSSPTKESPVLSPQGMAPQFAKVPAKGKKFVIILLIIFLILVALLIMSIWKGDEILNALFGR